MKRIAAIAAFLVACFTLEGQIRPGSVLDDLDDSETVAAIKEHVRTLSAASMEGRKAGSEGEQAAAEYLETVLQGYGVDILSAKGGDTFGIRTESGDTLTSRNVIGYIQGYDRTLGDRFIVIGARLDNIGSDSYTVDGRSRERIYYGANGNASGLAALLEVARMLQTNRILLRRSVLLIGFGASRETFAGSWYFLNRAFKDAGNIDAMIGLDMLGTGYSGFYAYTASNADLNEILGIVSSDLNPVTPEITAAEPYPSDNKVFYDKQIPSVLFTTGRYPEHDTEKDTQSIIDYAGMEKEVEYLYNFSKYLINAPAPSFLPVTEKGRFRALDGVMSYYECDQRPLFLNSADPGVFLQKWVYPYLKYPKEAVREGIQGRVMVDFIIDAEGNIKNVHVSRSVDPLLDDEAVRVISASPRWKPGRYLGKKVPVALALPVEFRLEKKASFGINGYKIGKKKKKY
jgi:TonB family protein